MWPFAPTLNRSNGSGANREVKGCLLPSRRWKPPGERCSRRTPRVANPAIEVKAGEHRDLGALKLKRIDEQAGE
jgi:hypothetical protein